VRAAAGLCDRPATVYTANAETAAKLFYIRIPCALNLLNPVPTNMIIKSAEFVTSATKPSQYPAEGLTEIAFAGRSNVGKSSLINILVNRKHLVKTSSTPGRTQTINFFDINKNLTFVDLPGYGFARVPDAIKKKWGPMVETYLSGRRTLKAVVVIMDIRRTPRKEEQNLIEWLEHHSIAKILVLTKADKLSKAKQDQQRAAHAETLGVDTDTLILFSAKSRLGKEDLWQSIENRLEKQ
jgi:GTP-binding protein